MKANPILEFDLDPKLEKKIEAFCIKYKHGWAEIGDAVISWQFSNLKGRFNMLRVECNRCRSVFSTGRKLLDDARYGANPIYCPACQDQWNKLLVWQEALASKAESIIKRKFEAKKKEWLVCA